MVTTATLVGEQAAGVCAMKSQDLKNGSVLTQRKNGELKNGSTTKYRQEVTYQLFETDTEKFEQVVDEQASAVVAPEDTDMPEERVNQKEFKYLFGWLPHPPVWKNILAMVLLHAGASYGFIMIPLAKAATCYWMYALMWMSTTGVQAGAHRLWAHKTYKANFGVRLLLSLWHVLALQNDVYEWSRDHRAHHKFADTDADPHDSKKGFFFSHVGWLLCKKHPEVKRRGATLDLSDLERDSVVMFQRKWYIPMVLIFWGAIPTLVPVYCWGENVVVASSLCVLFRYVLTLNLTWLVNSWAHIYGYRPYDKRLDAVEATCRHLLVGEGFHNYHHAFPWDYSASELGAADVFNPATATIDFFHYMGWAWDLKKVTPDMVLKKKQNQGEPVNFHYYKHTSSFHEWATGLLSVAGPFVVMVFANHLLTVSYKPLYLPFISEFFA